MKTKSILLVLMAAIFCACDTPQLLESKANTIYIFRYKNEDYKNLIITYDPAEEDCPYSIPDYPKLKKDEPYFDFYYKPRDGVSGDNWNEKYSYDICELATESKLISLHGDYYIYFPYVRIGTWVVEWEKVARDGNWEQVCEVNPEELPVLCREWDIYSEVRAFDGYALDKITKKKRREMTIDDIVRGLNKVIDEGKLDKYSIEMIR